MKRSRTILPILVFILIANTVLSQDSICLVKDSLPNIHFSKNSTSLSKKNKQTLDSIVTFSKKCPGYSIAVYSEPTSCDEKYSMRAWDRINAAINYLVAKGIPSEELVFNYQQDGKYGEIRFRLVTRIGITGDPPPHPNLMKKKNE